MALDGTTFRFTHPDGPRRRWWAVRLAAAGVVLCMLAELLYRPDPVRPEPQFPAWEAKLPTDGQVVALAREQVAVAISGTKAHSDLPEVERAAKLTEWLKGGLDGMRTIHQHNREALQKAGPGSPEGRRLQEDMRHLLTLRLPHFYRWDTFIDAPDRPDAQTTPLPAAYEPLVTLWVDHSVREYERHRLSRARELRREDDAAAATYAAAVRTDGLLDGLGWIGLFAGVFLGVGGVRQGCLANGLVPVELTLDRHWATVDGTRYPLHDPEPLYARLDQLQGAGFVTSDPNALILALDARTSAMDGVDDPEARARLQQILASDQVQHRLASERE